MTTMYRTPKPETVLVEAFMREAGQGDLVASAQMTQTAMQALERAGYSIMRKPNTFMEQWKIDSLVNLIGQALNRSDMYDETAHEMRNERDHYRLELTGADAIEKLVSILNTAVAALVPADRHIDFTEPRDEILAKTGR